MNIYTWVLPSHLFCRRRSRCRGRTRARARRLPRVSTFRLRQRYLLDYPVLINSSGFIFIFTTPRSRQPSGWRPDRRRPILPSFLRGLPLPPLPESGKRDDGGGSGQEEQPVCMRTRVWSSTPSGTSWRRDGALQGENFIGKLTTEDFASESNRYSAVIHYPLLFHMCYLLYFTCIFITFYSHLTCYVLFIC